MKKYIIDTLGKIKKDTTISLISDIHFNEDINLDRLRKIYYSLLNTRPDYIFVLGDIVEDTRMSSDMLKKIRHFITSISEIAPVYFVQGNHELKTKVNGKWEPNINEEYFSMLSSIENFRSLDNKSVLLKENIALTGINLPCIYYDTSNELGAVYFTLVNDYLKNGLLGNLSNKSYNICLQHTPNHIMDKKEYEILLDSIKMYTKNKQFNFDLVVSGHLHNGLVPSYIDRFIPGNRGIMGITGSKKHLFQENCRGIKSINENTKGIILPAVNPLPEYPLLNKLLPQDSKVLVLKK